MGGLEPERKQIPLCDGFVAVPVWEIRRANQSYNEEERRRAALLNFSWEIKGTTQKPEQRCPSIWVDNITFLYKQGMQEPMLLLGRWKKEVQVYGEKQTLEGLVIAGGGHYERCARKPVIWTGSASVKLEAGDMSLREAANKEMNEEMGIDADNVKATVPLGYMDDVFSDPRCHGVRFAYLRWVEQEPRASEELKNIIAAPISLLRDLANREKQWTSPEGKKFGLILNHDQFLRLIITHPQVTDFLASIKVAAEQRRTPSAGVSMWS